MATAEVAIVVRAKNEASGIFKDVLRDIKRMEAGSISAFTAMKSAGKAAFLGIGAGAAIGGLALTKFAQDASAAQESLAKVNVVFRENAQEIEAWAKTAATSFGLSRQQALESAGTFGNLFSAMRIGLPDATAMSKKLIELAADIGSFNNVPVDDALIALRSGLVGEIEPLRRFGVAINADVVAQKAMQLGLADTKESLTESAKVQARYALILEQTQLAQGDFARTADGLANSQKTLSAVWADTKVSLGQILLPLLTKAAQAMSQFLIDNQANIQAFAKTLNSIATKIGDAANAISKTLKPALDFLDKGDRVAILLALAAVISGPLVAAMIVFAATTAIAFATNPITLFILAIAGIAVAITLIVRHWDQIWAGLQDAPMRLLNFVKRNFVDVLLGFFLPPLGLVAVILKHWNDIFEKMPAPVQHAMNTVAGFIESMVNRAIKALNKLIDGVNLLIDGFNKLPDKLTGGDIPNVANLPEVDFTRPTRDRFEGRGLGRFSDGQFTKEVEKAGKSLDNIAPSFGEMGSAAGAAADELTILEAAMDGIITRAEAMTLGLSEQQAAELELAAAHEAVLDEEFRRRVELNALALAYPNLTGEEVKFRVGLEAIAEHLRRTGESIQKFIYDTATTALEGFRSAFDQIFNKPTKEDSQLQLQLLEAERRKLLSPNASESQRKAFDAEIDRLRNLIAIRRNADDILQTRADIADNTALTDQAQATAAELYIAAIADASKQVQDNAGIVYLQTLATIGLKDQTLALTTTFANLNDAASNAAPLSLGQALEALAGLPDHGVSLLPVGSSSAGTTVNITTNFSADSEASDASMRKQAKMLAEEQAVVLRRAGFGGSYVTSGAYTPA